MKELKHYSADFEVVVCFIIIALVFCMSPHTIFDLTKEFPENNTGIVVFFYVVVALCLVWYNFSIKKRRIKSDYTILKLDKEGISYEIVSKPQKIKWSDLKKIEIVRYNGFKEFICFYTVQNKVKTLKLENSIKIQDASVEKFERSVRYYSGNENIQISVVDEVEYPQIPFNTTISESFFLNRRQENTDDSKKSKPLEGKCYTKKMPASGYDYNEFICLLCCWGMIYALVSLILTIYIRCKCIVYYDITSACVVYSIVVLVCIIIGYMKGNKNLYVVFRVDKNGVYLHNRGYYAITLDWDEIERIELNSGYDEYIFFCTYGKKVYPFNISCFYSKKNYGHLIRLKRIFRKYSNNNKLEIKTINLGSPLYNSNYPFSEQYFQTQKRKYCK